VPRRAGDARITPKQGWSGSADPSDHDDTPILHARVHRSTEFVYACRGHPAPGEPWAAPYADTRVKARRRMVGRRADAPSSAAACSCPRRTARRPAPRDRT
jgi:hypothetical protein